MTAPTSIYRELEATGEYYKKVDDEMWDNYHTIFLASGDNPETISHLLDLNERLDIRQRPINVQPKAIFKSSPHVLITNPVNVEYRQFYIEDYLEFHLGWKDRKNPSLYSPTGFDVFLITDEENVYSEWLKKPAVFGLEVFSLLDYQNWLKTHPGNG